MKKQTFNRILLVMSVISFMVAMLEGYFYYDEYAQYPIFKFMLMLQNSVEAFAFKADISLGAIIDNINADKSWIQRLVDGVYSLVVFVAPLCTMSFLYKAFETALKWNIRVHKDKVTEQIIIFGYNDQVKALLTKEKGLQIASERRVQVITAGEVPSLDELSLLEKGVTIVSFECLGAGTTSLKRFYRDIQMHRASVILLMEETYSKNFSLYQMLNESAEVPRNAKIYCNCEQESIRRIIEGYYDDMPASDKVNRKDLELIDMTQIQARKILEEHPLHAYYEGSDLPLSRWDVHMLVLGFGRLGQQMVLQAMTQGIIHSQNRILIDVVDAKIEEVKSIFENHFSARYFQIEKDEIRVRPGGADGELILRFRSMDLRYKKFSELLKVLGDQDPFTYVAVCIKDQDISLHCVLELERFFAKRGQAQVEIGIQMDVDQRVARYLTQDQNCHKNVFAMESIQHALSLSDILATDINAKAKEYAYIYDNMDVRCELEPMPEVVEICDAKNKEDVWRELALFKRDSNRSQSCHASLKERAILAFGDRDELLRKYFGPDGILHKVGKCWVFQGTEEELVARINGDPFLREMAMMEHRRWCYAMAIRGWRGTDGKKNESLRENPCMVDWETLCRTKGYTCKYDLQPLMLMYEQMKSELRGNI